MAIMFTLALPGISVSQCAFYPYFSPNSHFGSKAGCENFTITVTPSWVDPPVRKGDVIISLRRRGEPFNIVDLGDYTLVNQFESGVFIGHLFYYSFDLDEYDDEVPKSVVLSDLFGTQGGLIYYYKCHDQSEYYNTSTINYNGDFGMVVNGSLNTLIETRQWASPAASFLSGSERQFTVDGNFDIDVPLYCFMGQESQQHGTAHIRMLPGSSITVRSGNTLKIQDNYVIACDGHRWNSIEVESGATLILENTVLDNGHFEVNALAGSTVIATGSTFKDGAVGIHAEEGSKIVVDNCNFYFSGSLYSFYSGEPSILGNRTFAGILADNSNIDVSNESTFDNLLNGIKGFNSNISVEDCSFTNISDFGTNNWTLGNAFNHNGKGIHSGSTSGNTLKIENSVFDDVMCGIYTRGVNSTVIGNEMTEVLTGMQFDHSPGRNFDIKGNTISAEARGINFSWTGEVLSTAINEENDITLTGANSIGIDLTETRGQLKLIDHNDVSVGEGQTGINLFNSQNFWTFNNTVLSNGSLARPNFGIGIFGGRNNITLCNLLNSSNSGSANSGLFVSESPNGGHAGNLAEGWHFDFHFVSDALGTVFASNRMDDANHGLALGYPLSQIGAMIGQQIHKGNRWIGTHTIGAANYGGIQDFENSRFIIHAEDQSNPDLSPNNFEELENQGWFEHDPANHFTLNCGTVGAGVNPVPRSFPRSDDEFVATGVYDTTYDWGTRIWSSKRQLYAELLERGSLQSYPSIYGSFFNANATTTIGRFEQMERGIYQAYHARANDYVQINDWLVEEDSLFNLALGILTDLATEEDSSAMIGLLDDLSVLSESLQDLQSDRLALASDLDSLLAIPLGNLLLLNDTLTVSEDYEEYQQYVNALYFYMLTDSEWELDSTQRVEIEFISELCPYFAGPAIYRARALRSLYELVHYSDDTICHEAASERTRFSIPKNTSKIKVFPVPTTDYLLVNVPENESQIKKYWIFGLEGKMVDDQKTNPVWNLFIPLTDLQNGFYFLELEFISGKRETIRFIKN
ncbi:MAG: hypothetical protein IPH93_08720 [Saprospiraceae bacterium]|nr:hypothetical protein [Saprospiraceae bacterium]MBK7810578.1 hypothetical protein [Saprospiraceae bacterium]MBK9630169.1 hypothetical protein [Saprospiraceae bacterium]